MTKQILTYEEVSELLRYDPDAGGMYWRINIRGGRGIKAGDEAGTTDRKGYRVVKVRGKSYKSHRLAWLLIHQVWPLHEIDHINGVKSDNRIVNLRDVVKQVNQRNAKRRSDNRFVFTGINWHKGKQMWHSQIRVSGKTKHLGYFTDFFQCLWSRKQAEKDYGFHANHGR